MPSRPSTVSLALDKVSAKSNMSPALTRSRSRKVQPALKERAEAFLAKASADTSSPLKPKDVPSRKRKRGDVANQKEQSQVLVPESGRSIPKAVRKVSKVSKAGSEEVLKRPDASRDLAQASLLDEDAVSLMPKTQAKKASKAKAKAKEDIKEPQEKRLRTFRTQTPKSFREKLHRATSQRMIVIGRTRSDTGGYPQEDIAIVGSTGNIYTVTIGLIPTCTCPDSLKGNECKHKVYALHTVLKAPASLQYQRAFLTSELHEIFNNAPPLPTDSKGLDDKDGKRKAVDGECPICYMDFDQEHNDLVWCKAACGNNMHKDCFEQWAKSQAGLTVKCVYCRTPWQVDAGNINELLKVGTVGEEGYVNVADQLGMSGQRDYSTYHPFWADRHLGSGRRWH